MLSYAHGLPAHVLDAIADLERRTVAADGGRLKLEWETLRTRSGDHADDVLWWAGDRLLGFAGLYAFGGADVEVTGMVDPAARRQGIGASLLDAVLGLCRERGQASALLVVPRPSAGGHALARSRGGTLHHSEHALVLHGDPPAVPGGEDVVLRPATEDDVGPIVDILRHAFDGNPPDLPGSVRAALGSTYAVDEGGAVDKGAVDQGAVGQGGVVGTMRVNRSDGRAGVYGFAVAPDRQGRGIGRAALAAACRMLRAEGVAQIGLEVAVDNERALGLYTSLGFVPVTTEDYYTVAVPAAPPP